ncbi:hypothetical protein ACFY3M_38355 [Streptomyces mirabilis]|uniref:hypothetical protein n=1 Tax=Streptomyces mirabilis TaxID=68239 RepID=UPI0036B14116
MTRHQIREKPLVGTGLRRTGSGNREASSVDPHERSRLEDIRDNLVARIAEAEREGWLGEMDGLSVSLAAAEDELVQLDAEQVRASTVVHLGLPTFHQIAARTTDTSEPSA